MYNTYLVLNIFFDRSKELLFLDMLMKDQEKVKGNRIEWLKFARKRFYKFLRSLEKMRRRNKVNLSLRTKDNAFLILTELKKQGFTLDKPLTKRLEYIRKRWKQFTVFYEIKDCPHTNNVIENYFSASLKTHRKKQFRTETGLENKMKLSTYKKNQGFSKPSFSFLEWGSIFWVLNSS